MPLRLGLVILSAALYSLAFPPWDLWPIAFLALAPFFAALATCSPRQGFGLGLLWGTAAIWGVGSWVPDALSNYWEQPVWFGRLFALAASIVFAGGYAAGFGLMAVWLRHRTGGPLRIVLLATSWVTWEFARARLLTGDPWLLAGDALAPATTLAQLADSGGVYALSFLIAAVNAAIAEAVMHSQLPSPRTTGRRRRANAALAVALLAATYAYGRVRLGETPPPGPAMRVAIVQANNDAGIRWRADGQAQELASYLDLSRQAVVAGAELIVWPESAVTFFLAREPGLLAPIASLLRQHGVELIAGAPHYELSDPARPDYYNSAFHFDTGGRLDGRYDKEHLLPFAEYFPLRVIEFLRRKFERVRSFTPGNPGPLLETRAGPVATAICFEGIFPELVRQRMAAGALALVNLSNDAWLGTGAGPEQHLLMVGLRAIEHRTWVIRATTTGISAFIDPWGRIHSRAPAGQAATLIEEITFAAQETPYQRWGDSFAYLCVVASVAACFLRKKGKGATDEHG